MNGISRANYMSKNGRSNSFSALPGSQIRKYGNGESNELNAETQLWFFFASHHGEQETIQNWVVRADAECQIGFFGF